MSDHDRRRQHQQQLMQALGLGDGGGGSQPMRKISDFPNWDDAPYLVTDFYIYNALFGTVAASATSNAVNITIQADSKFEWMKSSIFGYKDGETEPFQSTDIVPMTIIIQDSGSGRLLMNTPIPVSSIAGNGQLPFILPESRIFQPNATVSFTLANLSTSQYDNVQFSMIGRKIFRGED